MTPEDFLKNKKVLVMGLGLLGGGLAVAKWLVKHGARVTITDLKTKKELANSIKALGPSAKKVKLVLGRHDEADFKNHDIVVVNPAVPRESPFLKIARAGGAKLENEASLFFRFCQNPIIAVTGTRGKTTTVNWIHHFLKQKFGSAAILTGNSSDNPMLKVLDSLDGKTPVVVELSSWHLELLPTALKAPRVAVITNIFADHLNRYQNIRAYAAAKANIFKHQTEKDFLILNKGNKWTKFFLGKKPRGKVLYSDDAKKYCSGRFHGDDRGYQQRGLHAGARSNTFLADKNFADNLGAHNLQNLKTAALAANLAGVGWPLIKKGAATLPQIKFRQEVILDRKDLIVVNDTAATSPDAAIAALARFNQHQHQGLALMLMAGGTDKNLDFRDWAKAVKKNVKPENLFLLAGSATAKMVLELNKIGYFGSSQPRLYPTLTSLLTSALKYAKILESKKILLFSPGAASFEKFKNEFDRGEKFNVCLRTALAGGSYKH